jgi:hypothetical protein
MSSPIQYFSSTLYFLRITGLVILKLALVEVQSEYRIGPTVHFPFLFVLYPEFTHPTTFLLASFSESGSPKVILSGISFIESAS